MIWPLSIRKIAANYAAGKGFSGTEKDLLNNVDLDDPQAVGCLEDALDCIDEVISKIDFWAVLNSK